MTDYQSFHLSENPFPEVATLDPSSPDAKVNGEIFCEEIVGDEMRNITEKMNRRVNVIYVAGLEFDKGVGKSALVAHQWRPFAKDGLITTPYVRCKSKNKPDDFCDLIVREWGKLGTLWNAFGRLLEQYSSENPSPSLTREAIELMLKTFQRPPEILPLTRFLHITKPHSLAKSMSDWMSRKELRIDGKFGEFFAEQNLTHPEAFFDGYLKLKSAGVDRIDWYKSVLYVLRLCGYQYHYIFLDQFEDSVMPISTTGMASFCLGMRRIIEASQGLATILVTLHPDSETKLDLPGAGDLVKIAPVDDIHRVDVGVLEQAGDDAIALAKSYFDRYRTQHTAEPTYPLAEDVIRYICFLEGGNVRRTLQKLHVVLRHAAEQDIHSLTMEYVQSNHRETIGTELQPDLLQRFESSSK